VLREGYTEHTRVAQAIARVTHRGARPLIADLGCGTGMIGDALRAAGIDARLVGVDMSEAMLSQARTRRAYEALHRDDIVHFLAVSANASFDSVVLASVIPFFGDLRALFTAIARVVRPGGALVFSHDLAEDGEVQFNVHGRFRHGRVHVAQALGAAGFDVESSEPFVARIERGDSVAADVVVARRR
jgi:predicted TPR repeat methyltransferase